MDLGGRIDKNGALGASVIIVGAVDKPLVPLEALPLTARFEPPFRPLLVTL